MTKYRVTLEIKEYYEMEIEADSYEKAVDIANDTEISYFNETGIITERFDVEEIEQDERNN
jgi:hypothetical protein